MLRNLFSAAAIALAATVAATSAMASTVRIAGGETSITFDPGALAALASFHITPTIDNGDFDPDTATATYGISGGSVHGDDLTIEHVPSTLTLTNEDGTSASLSDFLIQLDAVSLTGTVSARVGDSTDFTEVLDIIAPAAADLGVQLVINDALGAAVSAIFSTDDKPVGDLSGAVLGTAVTSPQVVPVPAALPLLLAGLGGMAFVARRRKT